MKKILLSLLLMALSVGIEAMARTTLKEGGAAIEFATVTHNFGVINEADGEVACDFVFSNIGTRPLVIVQTKTSCECTLAHHPKNAIAPGKKGKIRVEYSPIGSRGNFMKNIYVYSNGSRQPITLYVKGKIRPVGR